MTKKIFIPLTLIVLCNVITTFGQSGTSKNLAPKKYQSAKIYLNTGEILEEEVLIFVKNKLHHSSKYKVKSENKDKKLSSSIIDSIQMGGSTYSKISYKLTSSLPKDKGKVTTVTKFSQQLIEGKNEVWISYWVDDDGYTFVNDKAHYLTYSYYLKKNGKYYKIENPRLGKLSGSYTQVTPSKKEYKYVIRKIKKHFPTCSEVENIDPTKNYDDIPNIVSNINNTCESTN